MTDRIAEQGAVQYGQNNPTSAGVSRLGAAGRIQAAIADAITNGYASLTASRLGGNGRFYAIAANAGPLFLFQNSEVGVWYDPSDFSTMFQDSAGTTPVTAVEQPVGLILDKSGNGYHATQSTSTARPVLRQDANGKYYLDFDGVDDFLVTSAIDFTGTDKMSVFAGVKRDNDVVGMLCELSADTNANAGSFFHVVGDALKDYSASSRGTAASAVGQASNITFAGPDLAVFTATHDISGDSTVSRRNGASGVAGTADKGLGAFGNYPIYIGMRAGTAIPFNGRIYSLIVRGALSDAAQIAAAESYVNSKTGAY